MEMHQVRYFLAVCKILNFTRAAERCNVAQPSLTRAIQKLEDELGGPLFRRERNRTHLTDLGRLMLPHLRALQDASLTASAEAEDYHKLERAPLRLGIMCTIGPARLVSFFARLHREIPSLELQLREAPGRRLVADLLAGELDVAVAGLPDYAERIDVLPLFEERYLIAFPSGHRFQDMAAVPLRELDNEAYLKRLNCEFSDFLDHLALSEPPQIDLRYSSEREEWVQAMVLAGLGCSIMPEHVPVLPGLSTRVLVEPQVKRQISLLTVSGRRFSPTVSAFLRLSRHMDWHA